jgi:CRISPR/Cas system CSM-associated protein Csm2 small subunit
MLWPGYLTGGYFDAAGNLKPEYVERSRILPLVNAMGQAHLNMHQARRFFQHSRAIEARLRSRTSTWAAEEAAFRKLDVAAADAFGKKDRKIPRIFHDFIEKNVNVVRTEESFLKGFLPHFEAIIGFGAGVFREGERS